MKISVVIPTRNRPEHLRKVLQSLHDQTYPPVEVIVVDSSEPISFAENEYKNLNLSWIPSIPSVCIQRNLGINKAQCDWILLCDDDLELPSNYLEELVKHIEIHPEAGAVSGVVLQKQKGIWVGQYPLTSAMDLFFRYIFHLSIWGNINVGENNFLITHIKNFYKKKGNHISKSGWPVITDFSGDYFKSPTYGLGASLVRKDWLTNSPYDEVLDPHGMGDNYGVALGFPPEGIHVLNKIFVYHHEAIENRLESPAQYFRRILALDYFIGTKVLKLKHVKRCWLLWSLLGSLAHFLLSKNKDMIKVTWKLIGKIITHKNPYAAARMTGSKICCPEI